MIEILYCSRMRFLRLAPIDPSSLGIPRGAPAASARSLCMINEHASNGATKRKTKMRRVYKAIQYKKVFAVGEQAEGKREKTKFF